jgi:hypothetical protein
MMNLKGNERQIVNYQTVTYKVVMVWSERSSMLHKFKVVTTLK